MGVPVPTVTIRNSKGDEAVVNAFDYANGLGACRSVIFGGDWQKVSESHKGGDEGHQASKEHTLMVEELHLKRRKDPIRK